MIGWNQSIQASKAFLLQGKFLGYPELAFIDKKKEGTDDDEKKTIFENFKNIVQGLREEFGLNKEFLETEAKKIKRARLSDPKPATTTKSVTRLMQYPTTKEILNPLI